jgi:hypothetical protein
MPGGPAGPGGPGGPVNPTGLSVACWTARRAVSVFPCPALSLVFVVEARSKSLSNFLNTFLFI